MQIEQKMAPNKAATKHDVAWGKHFALLESIGIK